MVKQDLYTTLGVSRNATTEEIKKAHRRAAKRHHPDVSGKDGKEYMAVQKAYEILKDDERRKRYDETGATDQPRFSVETEIANLFEQLLKAGVDAETDLLTAAKQSVTEGVNDLEKQKVSLKYRADQLRKAARRLKYKKNKLVHECLEGKARTLDETAARVPDQINFGKLLIKTLEEMEYEAEKEAKSKQEDRLEKMMERFLESLKR